MQQVLVNMTGNTIDIYDSEMNKIRTIEPNGRMYLYVQNLMKEEKYEDDVLGIPIASKFTSASGDYFNFGEELYNGFKWSDVDTETQKVHVITPIDDIGITLSDIYEKPYTFLYPGYTQFPDGSIKITHFILHDKMNAP